MSHESQIDTLADEVRSSGVLGRSDTVPRLFAYLLQQSREGRVPKELEIAHAVFNKDERFDVATDSIVRVYVHKLRRKLEDHYSRTPDRPRLVVPKGEYRLVVEAPGVTLESAAPPAPGDPAAR